ncbi:MAG: hypothetical protein ACTHOU_02765 [Aureliella sp.]
MAEKQQGASFTFGTSGGTWNYLNIPRYSEPIPVIDDTHLGTTGRRTNTPGELGSPQMITLLLQNQGDAVLPVKGLLQTGTITAPLGDFDVAEKWAGTGYVVDIRSPEFGSDTEAIATIEIDWMFDGKTGPARTAASVTP